MAQRKSDRPPAGEDLVPYDSPVDREFWIRRFGSAVLIVGIFTGGVLAATALFGDETPDLAPVEAIPRSGSARPDLVEMSAGQVLHVDVTANDVGLDGQRPELIEVASSRREVEATAVGQLVRLMAPNEEFSNQNITYVAEDASGQRLTGEIQIIHVAGRLANTMVVDDTVEIDSAAPTKIDVLANDSDDLTLVGVIPSEGVDATVVDGLIVVEATPDRATATVDYEAANTGGDSEVGRLTLLIGRALWPSMTVDLAGEDGIGRIVDLDVSDVEGAVVVGAAGWAVIRGEQVDVYPWGTRTWRADARPAAVVVSDRPGHGAQVVSNDGEIITLALDGTVHTSRFLPNGAPVVDMAATGDGAGEFVLRSDGHIVDTTDLDPDEPTTPDPDIRRIFGAGTGQLRSGGTVRSDGAPAANPPGVAFFSADSTDDGRVFAATPSGDIHLADTDGWRLAHSVGSPVASIAVSSTGATVAAADGRQVTIFSSPE